jgi:hypothetical protein
MRGLDPAAEPCIGRDDPAGRAGVSREEAFQERVSG